MSGGGGVVVFAEKVKLKRLVLGDVNSAAIPEFTIVFRTLRKR